MEGGRDMLKNNKGETITLNYGAQGNPVVPVDYDLVTQITKYAMDMVAHLPEDDGKGTRRTLLAGLPLEWDLMDKMVQGLFLVNLGSLSNPKWDYLYGHQPARPLFDSVHHLIFNTVDPDKKRTPRGQATWRAILDVMEAHMEYPNPGLFDEVVHLIHNPRKVESVIPEKYRYWGGPTREAHFKHIRDIALAHA